MKRGFTLIELIVTMGILIALSLVAYVNLTGRNLGTQLNATVQEVASTIRQAQSDAMAQENGTAWGVHFDNSTATAPFYALYSGDSYTSGTVKGYYPLPASVAYVSSSIAQGSSLDVTFSQVTGAASASTSITFYMPNESSTFSSTVSIASSGAVRY